jgi:AraC-like DNA-binding protein
MRTYQPRIALASYFQFAPTQSLTNGPVRSRMLLWCKAGRGQVRVNTETRPCEAGDVLLTPWAHTITYTADAREPFLLAGIHLIPREQPGTPAVWGVAHTAAELPALARCRSDALWPGLAGVRYGHFDEESALPALAEYVVRRCRAVVPPAAELRTLAVLLVAEMTTFFRQARPAPHTLSLELQRARQYLDDHLQQPLYLAEAAAVAGRSVSWLHRQFRCELQTTPAQYILAARLRIARHLLVTSTLGIAEVGQAVGLEDPFYFSKLFKRRVGVAPCAYRRSSALLS